MFAFGFEKFAVTSSGGIDALNRKLFTFIACFMYVLSV